MCDEFSLDGSLAFAMICRIGDEVMAMATIDVEKLRRYLLDCCGSAMMSGFPPAVLDVVDVERADGRELCRMAERMGVDLRKFVVDE